MCDNFSGKSSPGLSRRNASEGGGERPDEGGRNYSRDLNVEFSLDFGI
jgi:hypothetical protein